MIKAKNEFLASKTNFERVTREKTPETNNLNEKVFISLPNSLKESLELASLNNIQLLSSKLDLFLLIDLFNIFGFSIK